jgi:hypothetical protein
MLSGLSNDAAARKGHDGGIPARFLSEIKHITRTCGEAPEPESAFARLTLWKRHRAAVAGTSKMRKTVPTIAGAAALAALAMLLPAMTPEGIARGHDPVARMDRADHLPTCEHQGWPYYDAGCLHDAHRNAGRVPAVRVITIDHVKIRQPAVRPPANPLAVPAWPNYLDALQTML